MAGGSVAARCGHYRVRENRDDTQSKELQLHVAVIPALRLKPAADPLFILSGGPGQAASDFYLSAGPAFARIRRDRDLVIVDQRGTGRSNRLDCGMPDDSEFVVLDQQKLQAAVRECLAALPGDPRYYTTSVAVRDLDDIRAALGYGTLNIYGISYGTRVAQHYMRRYPDRVRAAILDGVVPAEVALGPDIAIEAQRAIDITLQRCSRDAACAQQFPDVSAQFTALQARLSKEPVKLSIPHPRFRERRFVLAPLAEVAPGLRDPVTGLTVSQLLAKSAQPNAMNTPPEYIGWRTRANGPDSTSRAPSFGYGSGVRPGPRPIPPASSRV